MPGTVGSSQAMRGPKIALMIAVGFVPGFFGVLNSLFSDGAAGERLGAVLINVVVYFAIATIVGFVDSHDARADTVALVLPAFALAALLIISGEAQMLRWAVFEGALIAAAVWRGADTGAWLHERAGHGGGAHHHGAHPA